MYTEDLIKDIRRLGLGCRLHDVFPGIMVYADDVILLSPSRSGLQEMLKVMEKFANKNNIVFSTHEVPSKSKSKCIWFNGKSGICKYPKELLLNGKELPWVQSALHLGHELTQECDMEHGAWVSRAKFIDKSNDIMEMFHFAHPLQKVKAMEIYCNDWYGSCLWNLFGPLGKTVLQCLEYCGTNDLETSKDNTPMGGRTTSTR